MTQSHLYLSKMHSSGRKSKCDKLKESLEIALKWCFFGLGLVAFSMSMSKMFMIWYNCATQGWSWFFKEQKSIGSTIGAIASSLILFHKVKTLKLIRDVRTDWSAKNRHICNVEPLWWLLIGILIMIVVSPLITFFTICVSENYFMISSSISVFIVTVTSIMILAGSKKIRQHDFNDDYDNPNASEDHKLWHTRRFMELIKSFAVSTAIIIGLLLIGTSTYGISKLIDDARLKTNNATLGLSLDTDDIDANWTAYTTTSQLNVTLNVSEAKTEFNCWDNDAVLVLYDKEYTGQDFSDIIIGALFTVMFGYGRWDELKVGKKTVFFQLMVWGGTAFWVWIYWVLIFSGLYQSSQVWLIPLIVLSVFGAVFFIAIMVIYAANKCFQDGKCNCCPCNNKSTVRSAPTSAPATASASNAKGKTDGKTSQSDYESSKSESSGKTNSKESGKEKGKGKAKTVEVDLANLVTEKNKTSSSNKDKKSGDN